MAATTLPGRRPTTSRPPRLRPRPRDLTTSPGSLTVGGEPIAAALEGWLGANGFPVGDRTRVWTWESEEEAEGVPKVEPMAAISDALLDMSIGDVELTAGYTDNDDKAAAMVAGGVPREGMFTLGGGAGSYGSTSIPEGDLRSHVDVVAEMGEACPDGQ